MHTVAEARARLHEATSEIEQQQALTALAAALFESNADAAAQVAAHSLELASKLGDAIGAAWARHNRGWALASLGRLDEALADQLAALAEFEAQDHTGGIAHTLVAIGDLHGEAGDTATALEYLEAAATPMSHAGDELGRGVILNLTGIALSRESRHREAVAVFRDAETIFEGLADAVRITTTKINRGFELIEVAGSDPTHVGEVEQIALDAIEEGLGRGEDGRNTVAYGHSLLSKAHAAAGRFEQAIHDARVAEEVARSGGFDLLALEIALDRLGWMIATKDLVGAEEHLASTSQVAASTDNRRALVRTTEMRADLLEARGNHADALEAYREFHRLDRQLHGDEAERRSRLTMARLEVESARREAHLAQTRVAELEALDHEKRDFLASVSHELRTPLTAVMGFASELVDSWDRFGPSEARDVVRLIARQSADISDIVDDLLTVTRLEAGTMRVRPQPLDVTQEIGTLVEALARDGGREIEWTGHAKVIADPTRLRQIVRNLVTNAIRYGGGRVRVTVAEHGNYSEVEVHDSGGPIPPARVDTMFNPFEHWDDGGRTPNSVGLGLAVARSLARLMHGDLTYRYEDGESIFCLSLPRP